MPENPRFAEFVAAQNPVYDRVTRELAAGHKQSHWMWFVFPQLLGLGSSGMAQKYALSSVAEASSYLAHPVLGKRLRECTQHLLAAPHGNVSQILGYPDDLKVRSCMTLFALAAPDEPIFQQALDKFFGGERDERTLELLQEHSARESTDRRL